MNKKERHIKAIKTKLNLHFPKDKDSIYKIVQSLNDDFGYNFTYNTVYNTLKLDNNTLNTVVVIALCNYWNLDLNYILADPDDIYTNKENVISHTQNDKFQILNDKKYEGKYYCYFLSHFIDDSPTLYDLNKATLEIFIDENNSKAIFKVFANKRTYGDDFIKIEKIFYGTPYLVTFSNNIIIFLTNDLGDFYFLAIDYKKYDKSNMYFRIGNLQSSTAKDDRPPIMQQIAIFRKEVKEENEKYVLGFLSLNSSKISIRKKDLDALKENDDIVDKFVQEFNDFLQIHTYPTYIFNEQQILHEFDIDMEKDDILKALFLIKNASLSPKFVLAKEDNNIPRFSKKL